MRIDWKQKLTSRKFWVAVIGFITEILVLFNVSDLTISHVVGLITAASILVAYIIGEGMVDAARIQSEGQGMKQTRSLQKDNLLGNGINLPKVDHAD